MPADLSPRKCIVALCNTVIYVVYPISSTQSLDIYATMFPSCAEDLATSNILAAIFEKYFTTLNKQIKIVIYLSKLCKISIFISKNGIDLMVVYN